jgi:site-specific DNA-methyltransferase (adenine-specific)
MIDLYCCDNIELLSTMADSSIQLIYCDIPFGTGKSFGDYDDKITNIEEYYRPRFLHMQRILKDTGLLYIHCDYHNSYYLKILLDTVFGQEHFRNEIIWYFNSGPRKNKDFGKRHNTIFRYSKTDQYLFNPIRVPYSLTAPRGYAKEKYYHPDGKVIDDVWIINSLGQNDKTERVDYSTQKPIVLLERIILSSSNENDTIADFFLGSGTTAIAALKHARHFIGCDINPKSIQVTKERLLI